MRVGPFSTSIFALGGTVFDKDYHLCKLYINSPNSVARDM